MERKQADIVVIGAGPGGYVAAIKAAQTGRQVHLIDKGFLGGSCLNVGCIPTKTLLANAEVLHAIKKAELFGIHTGPVSFDYAKMKQRKDGVVEKIRKSLEGLLLSNKIIIVRGTAEFVSSQEIKVQGQDNLILSFSKAIIATGSEPLNISAFPCDHKKIFNSSSILELTHLPKSIAIIGGGYIGCEFASLYAALGVKVTIFEAMPSIIAFQGKTIADVLASAFVKQGIDIHTNVLVEGIDQVGDGLSIRLKDRSAFSCDIALVAIGRKICSDGLELQKAAIQTGSKGEILVNDNMETSTRGIYAIGDVTGKFLLAHVASHQGIVAAVNATAAPGKEIAMHYNAVPSVIFTSPEIATVGMTQEAAAEAGYSISIGKFPFQALGKSIATSSTEGFAQVVSDSKTGQILGAQVVGHDAANLIAEMTLAMTHELTIESVADTIHAHPTVAEAWLEAALLANNTPIHFPPKKSMS